MKKITIFTCLLISALSFAGVGTGHSHGHGHSHGGSGHSHGIAEHGKVDAKKAEELARKKIRVLIFQEKINKTWNDSKLKKAEIKTFEGKKEWVLTFSNEKGVKGKTLYVFLKETGEFVAANFTGK